MAESIILIDPLFSGELFRKKVQLLGFKSICVYTMDHNDITTLIKNKDSLYENADKVIFSSDYQTVLNKISSCGDKIRAVIPATEPGVVLASELAYRLGLVTNTPELTYHRRNKLLMKKSLEDEGVLTPKQQQVSNFKEAKNFVDLFGFPVVVKPALGAGSSLVNICYSLTAVEKAVDVVLTSRDIFQNPNKYTLIETYVPGEEYIVNLFNDGKTFNVIDILKYSYTSTPLSDHLIHSIEALNFKDNPSFYERFIDSAIFASKSLGIIIGPSHVELKCTTYSYPQIIEVGARLPGAGYPESFSIANPHLDLFNIMILTYLNGKYDFPTDYSKNQKYLSIVFMHSKDYGIFTGVEELDRARSLSSFVNYKEYNKPGDIVKPSKIWGDAVGVIHLANSSIVELNNDVEFIKSKCKVNLNALKTNNYSS